MGQRRAGGDVADGVDVLGGPPVGADHDPPVGVERDAGDGEAEVVGVRSPPDGDHDEAGADAVGRALGASLRRPSSRLPSPGPPGGVPIGRRASPVGPSTTRSSPSVPRTFVPRRIVTPRARSARSSTRARPSGIPGRSWSASLDDGDVGAELGEGAAQFDADVAAADDGEPVGDPPEREGGGRIEDPLPVEREGAEVDGAGAGGQHHGVELVERGVVAPA